MNKIIAKYAIGLLPILVCCVEVFSQHHSYVHYTVKDGLPSSEVYSAFQDSKGYLWFATDAGVSRFNGYEFRNFDASDGLTDNTVFLIREDYRGRIWFGTFNCMLSYFENNTIHPYPYNHVIADHITSNSPMHSFYIDSLDNVWFGLINDRAGGLFKCTPEGKVENLMNQNEEVELMVEKINDELIYGSFTSNTLLKKRINGSYGIHEYMILVNDDKTNTEFEGSFKKDLGRASIIFEAFKNDIVFYDGADLFLLKEVSENIRNQIIHIPQILKQNRWFSVYSDHHQLWICVENMGAFNCELKGDSLTINDHFLKDKSVARMFRDNENGYWFQTLKEGVYYLSNPNVKHTRFKDKNVTALEVDTSTGQVYVGFDNGEVSKLLKSENKYYEKEIATLKLFSNELQIDYQDQSLYIGKSTGNYYKYSKGKLNKIDEGIYESVKSILIDSNHVYMAGNSGLIRRVDGKLDYYSLKEGEPRTWCTSLLKANNGRVWVGTNVGVRVFYERELTDPFQKNKYLSSAITCMKKLNDQYDLIGTKSFGLLIIENDSVVKVLNRNNGLIDHLIRSIHVDNEGTIWIGTRKGISKVLFKDVNHFEVQNFTDVHGLITPEVYEIKSFRNTLYVSTPEGLIEFDRNKMALNSKSPELFVESVSVNSLKVPFKEQLELSYKENLINIDFLGVNFRSLGKVVYQYRMLGVDTNWTTTTSRTIQYSTLQPGSYKFQVRARNEDSVWSTTEQVSFIIQPPFWLTWWFITLMIVLGTVVLYGIVWYQFKRINEKTSFEKQLLDLELKALRSQMNPHFIFNTLNTIQNAVNTLDKSKTSNYIATFGRLIRMVLETSKHPKVLLKDEIEMLRLYVELEEVRFSNKFVSQISLDEELEADALFIPSMVIQPFVENAILHGLVPKEEKDLILKIEFKQLDDAVLCVVEDNGIGRIASAELNRKKKLNKTSMGMSITRERLNLYDQMEGNNFSFEVIDLVDKNNNSTGTRVEIKFIYT